MTRGLAGCVSAAWRPDPSYRGFESLPLLQRELSSPGHRRGGRGRICLVEVIPKQSFLHVEPAAIGNMVASAVAIYTQPAMIAADGYRAPESLFDAFIIQLSGAGQGMDQLRSKKILLSAAIVPIAPLENCLAGIPRYEGSNPSLSAMKTDEGLSREMGLLSDGGSESA